jgi:outer membrane protein assembly factor BamB
MRLTAITILLLTLTSPSLAEDWPRWRGPRGDGTWKAPAIPERWPDDGPAKKWSAPIGGGYSGVTVSEGRVYTMDRLAPPRHEKEVERIHCLDAATGAALWTHAYEAPYGDLTYNTGPRADVTIYDGRAYSFGAVGHAFCLDAKSGKVLWSKDTVKDHKAQRPYWGFAASPVIHGDLVLIHAGVPKGSIVAYDRKTGEEKWRGGDDPAGYCTPIIIESGTAKKTTQLICWTPESILGMSPATGEVYWRHPYKILYGVSIHTPIFNDGTLFISSYWHGPRAFALGDDPRDVKLIWEHEKVLCGLMSQPLYRDGHCYFLDKDNGLTCFELKTGRKRWDDRHEITPRGRNPHATLVWLGDSDRAIILNSKGELILARLTPKGYEEHARTKIIGETWAHPAYAGRFVYARDDREMVCVEIAR